MEIESKPMLQRTKRAYEAYLKNLESETASIFSHPEPEEPILEIKAEIEASREMIRAIDYNLSGKLADLMEKKMH